MLSFFCSVLAHAALLSPIEQQVFLFSDENNIWSTKAYFQSTEIRFSSSMALGADSESLVVNSSRDQYSKGLQLRNLKPSSIPRYTITDRQWPEAYGETHISMWKDDKLAAFSLTIDDNTLPDHSFWLQLGDEYGWSWTWFVIANEIRTPPSQHSWWGNWKDWQTVLDRGHDVQSHEMTQKGILGFPQEYGQAIQVINSELNGANVLTMAYNGSTSNTPDVAKQWVCGARSTIGSLENPAKIDFMNIHSVSGAKNFFASERHWASFAGLLDPNNNKKGRGWYLAHLHKLNDSTKTYIRSILDYIKVREADIWVGTFRDVVLYAQEFATARILNKDSSSANEIAFDVSDDMHDALYVMPLTVKVRLNNNWAAATAEQNGVSRGVVVIEHQGEKYALVDVVPDQGRFVLSRQ